jgi:hypothetical protein
MVGVEGLADEIAAALLALAVSSYEELPGLARSEETTPVRASHSSFRVCTESARGLAAMAPMCRACRTGSRVQAEARNRDAEYDTRMSGKVKHPPAHAGGSPGRSSSPRIHNASGQS